jgi:endonuclease YncB( thermonuclease family)
MGRKAGSMKALLVSAFFVSAAPGIACGPDHVDARGFVEQVVDGDTVRVRGHGAVRLIGLDAPETAREDRPAEPYADQAAAELRSLIASRDGPLLLRYGSEARDRYGRLLAHVFLSDGSSLSARMLEAGLATSLTIPPNTWNLECYLRAEQAARSAGRGVWGLEDYQPMPASRLGAKARGFRVVQGRVVRIGQSRHALWIELEGGLTVKIDREDLPWFGEPDPTELRGRRIEVRGHVYRHRGEPRIKLRHSAALRPLD